MNEIESARAWAAAETLRDQGEHVHYATEGQSLCLSGTCITVVGP
ncbi:hypothetical protein ACFT7S_28320 [Streptomyces sp. NPDC057136]